MVIVQRCKFIPHAMAPSSLSSVGAGLLPSAVPTQQQAIEAMFETQRRLGGRIRMGLLAVLINAARPDA
jgi:hypothetical protein